MHATFAILEDKRTLFRDLKVVVGMIAEFDLAAECSGSSYGRRRSFEACVTVSMYAVHSSKLRFSKIDFNVN